jgi:hypothetical protein
MTRDDFSIERGFEVRMTRHDFTTEGRFEGRMKRDNFLQREGSRDE